MIFKCIFVVVCLSSVRCDGPLFMDVNDPLGSVLSAKVNLKPMGNVQSFSGFLPLNNDKSDALFFWYFPSMTDPKNAPFIIWLQGWQTPGMYGLFMENGPFKVGPLDGLNKRTYAWNRFAHVVYIDSPVGTGFSFTSKSDYPTNSSAVASDLFTALSQLVVFFPEMQLNDLFIGGESYAGKYVPLLASLVGQDNRFKLKGIFLGNPFVDPSTQVNYGDYLYQHGLIDHDESQYFKSEEKKMMDFIKNDKFEEAAVTLGELIFLPNGNTYFNNRTGFKQYYNFVKDQPIKEFWRVFINLSEVKNAIHVGNLPFGDGSASSSHLLLDIPRSGKTALENVLKSNSKVLVYAGQDDIICASPMMEDMLDSLQWDDSDGFQKASRRIWNDGQEVAGYIREFSKLSTVMVRNAGHMAPMDQPRWIYLLIKNFVSGSPLDLV